MPEVTRKGRELARSLNPAIGTTRAIEQTCSLIARHATTHHHLQENFCNGESYEGEHVHTPADIFQARREALERRGERLEARIADLVADLPHTDDGPFGVHFQGDPRGCTVKLTAPGPWTRLYDDWGNEGICVPQR